MADHVNKSIKDLQSRQRMGEIQKMLVTSQVSVRDNPEHFFNTVVQPHRKFVYEGPLLRGTLEAKGDKG